MTLYQASLARFCPSELQVMLHLDKYISTMAECHVLSGGLDIQEEPLIIQLQVTRHEIQMEDTQQVTINQ